MSENVLLHQSELVDLGYHLSILSQWIDEYNKSVEDETQLWARCGKIGEEFGEVIAAIIGATGQNPRKGITHDIGDVEKELLDVAVTALGAVEHLNGNDGSSAARLVDHMHFLIQRAGL